MARVRIRLPRWSVVVLLFTVAALLPWPASADVTCRRERQGTTTIIYFCKNGFKCDNASNKCLPGPEILRKVNKLKQEAARLAKKAAVSRIAYRNAEDAKTFGKSGSTYYRWNGNPKIMPTPRYRRGGGFATAPRRAMVPRGGVRVPQTAARRLRVAHVPSNVQSQILALVAAAAVFQPGDPSRANITTTLRKLVKDHKIPIDVDDLLADCSGPKSDEFKNASTYDLRWRVPDIPFEVEKRGLCKDAKDQSEREACHQSQFGLVVMSVEPHIKALCKLQENDFKEENMAALGECASRKFLNAWALHDGKMPMSQGGTLLDPGKKCDLMEAKTRDGMSLRDRLRKLLAMMSDTIEVPGGDTADTGATPPPPPAAVAENAPPAVDDTDDAFCAFIARRSVRGELTPGGGAAIPPYCKKAMDEAKTCEQQQCSMADVVAEQEKKAAAGKALDWGAEDRAAISQLLSEVN